MGFNAIGSRGTSAVMQFRKSEPAFENEASPADRSLIFGRIELIPGSERATAERMQTMILVNC